MDITMNKYKFSIAAVLGLLLSGCATTIAKLSYNDLTGKTANEMMNTTREGKYGPVWGKPYTTGVDKDGGQLFFYWIRSDMGITTEQCGQEMNPGVVIQYMCSYSNVWWKEWKIKFGQDGRVSEWKVVSFKAEKNRL